MPDFKAKGRPLASEVHHDHVYFLTRTAKLKFPITPPPLRNHGNYIISLNRFVKWLGGLVEAEGIDVFTGFPGVEVLYDGDRVVGVRTGDRGIGKHGERKSTFEPGVDIRAKVTILTDGVRGNLTKALVRRLALDEGRSPQLYAIGIKELWEIPADRVPAGTVIHTMGYPLRHGGVRRRVHLRHARRADVGRLRERPRLSRSDVRSAHHVSALQAASVRRVAARQADRWSATAPRRFLKAAGTPFRASTPTAC